MITTAPITIPVDALASFCQQNHIRRLSLFGSVLRVDFREDSDIDVLVEFEANNQPGLIGLAGMELELSGLFAGRKVEINTANFLSPYFRDKVIATAELVYDRP